MEFIGFSQICRNIILNYFFLVHFLHGLRIFFNIGNQKDFKEADKSGLMLTNLVKDFYQNEQMSQNKPVKMYVYSKKVCAIAVFVVAFFRLRMAFCSPPNINLISLSALFSDDHAWMALTTPPKKIIIKEWYLI